MTDFIDSDTYKLFLAIGPLLIAIVSIVISIFTLKQNSKMVDASTRPYVSIQAIRTNNYGQLIMKNYGNSSAYVISLLCGFDLKIISAVPGLTPFGNIVGKHFCPGEAYATVVDFSKIPDDNKFIEFNIKYKSTSVEKEYFEKVQINVGVFEDQVSARTVIDDKNALIQLVKNIQDVVDILRTK